MDVYIVILCQAQDFAIPINLKTNPLGPPGAAGWWPRTKEDSRVSNLQGYGPESNLLDKYGSRSGSEVVEIAEICFIWENFKKFWKIIIEIPSVWTVFTETSVDS